MAVSNTHRLQRTALSAALMSALLLTATSVAAQENQTTDQAENQTTTDLDEVVVTGSRIKRAEIEGPAPVTVITSVELEQQGFSTVAEALSTLTQVAGSVQNELTQSGFTPNASVIDLRGLGPGRVLTLINGRRAADYPLPYNGQSNFVNLAAIPSAAVERIEVLSGGASAIYGSDAVAGVVNIILKSNYEGDQVNLRVGTTTRGGGDSGNIEWVGGRTGDNWSLTYAFEHLAREEIFASQRDFMDSYRDDPSVDPEDATAVIGVRLRDRLVGTGVGSYVYPDGEDAASVCGRFSEFELQNNGACGYYGYPATQQIRNSDSNTSVYLNGTMDFTDTLQGFAALNVFDSEAKIAAATQFWQAPLYYDTNFGSIMDGQRIFTPDEVGGFGAQQTRIEERSYDMAVGLRGAFGERFDWDATLSHSKYDTRSERPRFVAQAVSDFFLGPQQGVDPFFGLYPVYTLNQDRYFNPISPQDFQSLITNVITEADSASTQANFVVTGDLFELPAGPLAMAAVLEAGSQEYTLTPDPRILPDADPSEAIYNLTGTGGGGERDRYAVGVEFSVPIFDSLKAQIAGRYDKYDDITAVDDAITYNFGLEWRPLDSLLLRGSYATSFRAPDMHFVFADTSGFFQTVFDEYQCRSEGQTVEQCGNDTAYQHSVFGTRSGNPGLEEEEGKSWTAGFVWDVIDGLSLSADYYHIELDGLVSDISTTYLLQNEADCRLGQDRGGNPVDPNSSSCQFFLGLVDRYPAGHPDEGLIDQIRVNPINQAYNAIEGIDATVRYKLDTDRLGDFDFRLSWSHTLSQEFEEFPGDGIDEYRDDLTNFDFRSRLNWTAAWTRDDWSAAVYGYRFGSAPNWAETGRIAPYIIWNASIQKQITEKASIGLAVNNVFDKIAPRDDTFFTYPFFWRAYSPVGREVFANFSYKFH